MGGDGGGRAIFARCGGDGENSDENDESEWANFRCFRVFSSFICTTSDFCHMAEIYLTLPHADTNYRVPTRIVSISSLAQVGGETRNICAHICVDSGKRAGKSEQPSGEEKESVGRRIKLY
jgi:hypothetical protein